MKKLIFAAAAALVVAVAGNTATAETAFRVTGDDTAETVFKVPGAVITVATVGGGHDAVFDRLNELARQGKLNTPAGKRELKRELDHLFNSADPYPGYRKITASYTVDLEAEDTCGYHAVMYLSAMPLGVVTDTDEVRNLRSRIIRLYQDLTKAIVAARAAQCPATTAENTAE